MHDIFEETWDWREFDGYKVNSYHAVELYPLAPESSLQKLQRSGPVTL